MKFLTIMHETRLSDGEMVGRYSEEVSKIFSFSKIELNNAVKKLLKMNMLSVMDIAGNEKIYFHTDKVSEDLMDKHLKEIRH